MRKQLLIYFASFLVFFLMISLARKWIDPRFIVFWVGGAIGAILPDVDHLIYVYLLKPHELTSQRATRMLSRGEVFATFSLLANTRGERTQLIFHTAMFQLIFAVFAFFVISSSNNLLGRGLVLAFSLHLIVDQYLDFKELGGLNHWFKNLKLTLDKNQTIFYWAGMSLLLVLYGFLF